MKRILLALPLSLAAISFAWAQTAIDTGGTIIPRVPAVGAYVRPGFSFTPSTSAYSSGYSLGGVQALATQPLGAIIANVSCQLSSGTFSGSIDLDVFNAQPEPMPTTFAHPHPRQREASR